MFPLEVTGDSPITIERVELRQFDDLTAPTIDAANLVTSDGALISSATCAPLKPASRYTANDIPQLVLTVSTDQPIAFNQNTQVFYHTSDGRKFVQVYGVLFALCLKGEVSRTECEKVLSKHL
jgi:hypothetical protein